jgi:energy-coupling factor transporter ATP-binding protein EcfA2
MSYQKKYRIKQNEIFILTFNENGTVSCASKETPNRFQSANKHMFSTSVTKEEAFEYFNLPLNLEEI